MPNKMGWTQFDKMYQDATPEQRRELDRQVRNNELTIEVSKKELEKVCEDMPTEVLVQIYQSWG